MKKRLCSLLTACALAAGLCAGLAIPAGAAYSDVTDAATAEAVSVLSGMGVVEGYSSSSYGPGDTLTRAQFCKMIVLASGQGELVSKNSYRSLFDDVASNSWALGYINTAYAKGLVSGYGDGTFGPGDGVTVAQAVTIALHALGYTTADVGVFWPEDYLAKAAALGLTDGISAAGGDLLTRGEAALLLYAMLRCSMADGSDFLRTVAASTVSSVLILDNDAESADGAVGAAAVYQNGTVSYYGQANVIDGDLVGRRGTLLLNSAGSVTGFVPDSNSYVKLTPKTVTSTAITSSAGSSYAVSSNVTVVLEGEKTTYGNAWYDLETRDVVTIFWSAAGAIDLIWAGSETKYEGIQLTGYYEDAHPNESNPTAITLLGAEFQVDAAALPTLTKFEVGDRITITLNAGGNVIAACSSSEKNVVMVGLLADDRGTVELLNGITVSGTFSNTVTDLVGKLVKISATGKGRFSATGLAGGVNADLDVSAGLLGTRSLAEDVVIYECVGKSSMVEISLEDILTTTVDAEDILYAGTNSKGLVNLLLLDDVTGDAYTYGRLTTGIDSTTVEYTDASGNKVTLTNRTVSVTNGEGSSGTYITGDSNLSSGAFGGVAWSDVTGKTTGTASLTAVKNISRSAFDGDTSVTVDGTVIPLSDNVQVYNTSSGKWVTLAQAKAFADTFTIYYDRTFTTGAKVRVIATQ